MYFKEYFVNESVKVIVFQKLPDITAANTSLLVSLISYRQLHQEIYINIGQIEMQSKCEAMYAIASKKVSAVEDKARDRRAG